MSTRAVQARRPRALGLPTNAVDFGPLVQRLAKERGPKVAAEYAAAVLKAQRDIDMAALERALRSGKAERVAQVLGLSNIQQQVSRAVAQPLTSIAQAAGQGSATLMSKHGVRARFDAVHPDVVQFARLQGSDLVTGIDRVTREVIREVIGRGAEGRLTVADQARAIREVVGLPKPWRHAPAKFEAELRAGLSSAATNRRLDAAMKQRLRSAINNNTLTDALVNEAREAYTASLVHLRARMIARTESARAASHGLQEGWKQAQKDGVLPASTRRWWIVTPDERLSRTHATIPSLNPKGRKLDEPFVTTEGLHMFPPSRPNCRCRIALTFGGGELRDAERAADAEIARRDLNAARPLRRIASEPLSGKAAMDMAMANAQAALKLTDVREALDAYVEEEVYADLNTYLRDPSSASGSTVTELQEYITALDKGFANTTPLTQDIRVYRGTPMPRTLRPGQTIPHQGYMSTAYGPGAASDFAGVGLTDEALGLGNVPTLLRIRVPEGTRAFGFKSLEAEIILPRGGELRIIGEVQGGFLDDSTGNVLRMFDAEYVPARAARAAAPRAVPAAPTAPAPLTGGQAWRHAQDIGGEMDITDIQRHALQRYSTKWHRPVNRQLRGLPDDPTDDFFPQEDVDKIKERLDKLFEYTPKLDRDIQVWRGSVLPDGVLRVGTEFIDNGFVSTAIDSGNARDFVQAGRGQAHLLRITVKKDSRIVALTEDLTQHAEEGEILLQRGGTFRVTGIDDATRIVDVEYLPPGSTPLRRVATSPSPLAQTIDVDEFPLAARGQLPSARGAEWKDLDNLPRARRFAADLDYDPDRFIQQSAVQEFEKILADDRFKLAKQQRTFFGIQTPDADLARVGIRNSDGTLRFNSVRTTANDLARAEAYAGADGVTFEVIMPKGTRAVHTSVAGLEEWQLLPGTRYDVVSQTTRSGRPHYVVRLTDDGSAHTAKIIDFKHELARAAKRDWNAPAVQQVVPRAVSKTVRHRLGPELSRGVVVTDAQVELAVKEATRLGISPRAVTFEPSLGRASAGRFEGKVLGEYRNGRISVVADQADRLQQTIAHEATHLRFEAARNADTKLLQDILEDLDGLMRDDGVTAYSRAHWQTAMAQRAAGRQTAMLTAVEETLAEIEALQALGQSVGTARYRALLTRVDDAYRKASQNGIAVPRRARRDAVRRAIKRRIEETPAQQPLVGAKANKHLTKLQKDIPALTEAQIEAHKQYQWYAYRPMNALLREYANDVDQFLSKSAWKGMDRATAVELANANRILQAHLEAMPAITEPVTVFRAIAPSGGRSYAEVRKSAAEWVERLQPGARLTDTGFISTTTDYRQAEKWLKKIELGVPDAPLSGIVFEVQLPPGTKGAWAPTVTPDIAAEVVVKNEFLLPPGGTFEVISTTRDEARNWLRVVVRYIARGQ